MHKTPVQSASSAGHDRSLLEWFATLTPEQRLAELESRIGFFLSLRPQNESQLSRDTRASQQIRSWVHRCWRSSGCHTGCAHHNVRSRHAGSDQRWQRCRLSLALDELDAHYREHQSTIKPTKPLAKGLTPTLVAGLPTW